jgi:hypothetical protein
MRSDALWPDDDMLPTEKAPHPLASAFDRPPVASYILIRIGDGPLRRWVPPGDPGEAPPHEPDATDQQG